MRLTRTYIVVAACGLLAAVTSQPVTITYSVTEPRSPAARPSVQRYTYFVSDVTFGPRQELDVVFDPAMFGSIANGMAGPGFDVLLFQPNDPPGTEGHFSAMALIGNPPLDPFSVDFIFTGPGKPGSQPFALNQYDEHGNLVETLETGQTGQIASAVPEAGNFCAGMLGLTAGVFRRAVSRRRATTA